MSYQKQLDNVTVDEFLNSIDQNFELDFDSRWSLCKEEVIALIHNRGGARFHQINKMMANIPATLPRAQQEPYPDVIDFMDYFAAYINRLKDELVSVKAYEVRSPILWEANLAATDSIDFSFLGADQLKLPLVARKLGGPVGTLLSNYQKMVNLNRLIESVQSEDLRDEGCRFLEKFLLRSTDLVPMEPIVEMYNEVGEILQQDQSEEAEAARKHFTGEADVFFNKDKTKLYRQLGPLAGINKNFDLTVGLFRTIERSKISFNVLLNDVPKTLRQEGKASLANVLTNNLSEIDRPGDPSNQSGPESDIALCYALGFIVPADPPRGYRRLDRDEIRHVLSILIEKA